MIAKLELIEDLQDRMDVSIPIKAGMFRTSTHLLQYRQFVSFFADQISPRPEDEERVFEILSEL